MCPITLPEPFRALLHAPFHIAEARGAFSRQGADLRMVTAGSPAAEAETLLAGGVDPAWDGPCPC